MTQQTGKLARKVTFRAENKAYQVQQREMTYFETILKRPVTLARKEMRTERANANDVLLDNTPESWLYVCIVICCKNTEDGHEAS